MGMFGVPSCQNRVEEELMTAIEERDALLELKQEREEVGYTSSSSESGSISSSSDSSSLSLDDSEESLICACHSELAHGSHSLSLSHSQRTNK